MREHLRLSPQELVRAMGLPADVGTEKNESAGKLHKSLLAAQASVKVVCFVDQKEAIHDAD